MKNTPILIVLVLLVGIVAVNADSNKITQIKNEIFILSGKVNNLSQQALALISIQQSPSSNPSNEESLSSTQVISQVLENNETEYPRPLILNKKGEYNESVNRCGLENKRKRDALFVLTGLYTDSKKNVFNLSDVWKTIDGVNWLQISKETKMGKLSDADLVKVGSTVYVFGGKNTDGEILTYYERNVSNSIYKSTDMINWSYVGEIPSINGASDHRDVVYINNKFYVLFSNFSGGIWNGSPGYKFGGVWSSLDGVKWKQEVNNPIWEKTDDTGYYKGARLGAYALNDKIGYSVFTNKGKLINFSSKDGANWINEGTFPALNGEHSNLGINRYFIHNGQAWNVNSWAGKPYVLNTNDSKKFTVVSDANTKFTAPRHGSVDISFNNKLFTIGGTKRFEQGGLKDAWSSVNGIVWKKIEEKGVTGIGPSDRAFAVGVTLPVTTDDYIYTSSKAPDLRITSTDTSTLTILDKKAIKKNQILGTWDFSGISKNDDVTYSGTIKISSIGLLGSDTITSPKFAPVKFASSLESLKNIRVFVDDGGGVNYKQVGFIAKFNGPFYDTVNNYALTQMINLSSPITLIQDQTKHVYITADFTFSSKLPQLTTYISGFGSPDSNSEPCTTYNGDINGTYGLYKGITIKNGNPTTGTTSIPSAGTGKPTTTITNPVFKMP